MQFLKSFVVFLQISTVSCLLINLKTFKCCKQVWTEQTSITKTRRLAYRDKHTGTSITSQSSQGRFALCWRANWSWMFPDWRTLVSLRTLTLAAPLTKLQRRLNPGPGQSLQQGLTVGVQWGLSGKPVCCLPGPEQVSPSLRASGLSSCQGPLHSWLGQALWSDRPNWPAASLAPWAVALHREKKRLNYVWVKRSYEWMNELLANENDVNPHKLKKATF